jgi:hypothetical protein
MDVAAYELVRENPEADVIYMLLVSGDQAAAARWPKLIEDAACRTPPIRPFVKSATILCGTTTLRWQYADQIVYCRASVGTTQPSAFAEDFKATFMVKELVPWELHTMCNYSDDKFII